MIVIQQTYLQKQAVITQHLIKKFSSDIINAWLTTLIKIITNQATI